MALNKCDLPNYILPLICILCFALYVSLTKCGFFSYLLYICLCVSIYETLFFCFWVFLTPGVAVYLYFVYFFFCASLIISPYQRLYSGCLCVSVLLARVLFLHVFLCISPYLFLFVPLVMACVCFSCLFAPIYLSITKWVSQCVRFSLSLLSMPVGD